MIHYTNATKTYQFIHWITLFKLLISEANAVVSKFHMFFSIMKARNVVLKTSSSPYLNSSVNSIILTACFNCLSAIPVAVPANQRKHSNSSHSARSPLYSPVSQLCNPDNSGEASQHFSKSLSFCIKMSSFRY